VVIARRLSHALNAEERSRTLQENARLREDVERISRHDLKTPLNSILGVTRLLRDDTRLSTEQRELVGVLQRAGYRMLEMVNLSLGLFKMETGTYDFRPQAVDLRDVVNRVLVDLYSHAEAHEVTLHLEGSDRAPVHVRADELLCYSIVANLVKNAVEASAPGHRVSVALHPGEPVALTVHNPAEVPPEIASRFFQKYVTRGKSGGTGLGTYSARLMARAQQGDLQLRTGAEGTTLTLTLKPLKEEPPAPVPATLAERTPAEWVSDLPQRELLLVDDDEYTRLVMRRFLPSPPFTFDTASNGQAAIDAMTRRWPQLLLLDMEMPRKSGVETLRWVREQEASQGRPRCHVVMMSGNDDDAAAAQALQAGADRFLAKPVSREALLSTLHDLQAGRPEPAVAAAATGAPQENIIRVDPRVDGGVPRLRTRPARNRGSHGARARGGGSRRRAVPRASRVRRAGCDGHALGGKAKPQRGAGRARRALTAAGGEDFRVARAPAECADRIGLGPGRRPTGGYCSAQRTSASISRYIGILGEMSRAPVSTSVTARMQASSLLPPCSQERITESALPCTTPRSWRRNSSRFSTPPLAASSSSLLSVYFADAMTKGALRCCHVETNCCALSVRPTTVRHSRPTRPTMKLAVPMKPLAASRDSVVAEAGACAQLACASRTAKRMAGRKSCMTGLSGQAGREVHGCPLRFPRLAPPAGMTPLSVLDLAPIVEGADAAQSFRNSLSLARHAEKLAIAASGWRNITACRASPVRRPPC
jgi:CheY-like chemotaxis protein